VYGHLLYGQSGLYDQLLRLGRGGFVVFSIRGIKEKTEGPETGRFWFDHTVLTVGCVWHRLNTLRYVLGLRYRRWFINFRAKHPGAGKHSVECWSRIGPLQSQICGVLIASPSSDIFNVCLETYLSVKMRFLCKTKYKTCVKK